MFHGYDVYVCELKSEELFQIIQKEKIEIFDIVQKNKITFLSTIKYRKSLITNPKIHYLYSKGLMGIILHFVTSKEKLFSFLLSLSLLFVLQHTIFEFNIYGDSIKHKKLIQNQLIDYKIPFMYFNSKNILIKLKELNQDLNWYEINQKGSKLDIRYLPRKHTILNQNQQYDLIASKDGVIASFDVSYGNKIVKINQKVNKGDILVSHILIDSKQQEKTSDVMGKVYAYTFLKIDVEILKNKLPKAVQYYECLLRSRNQIKLDKDEKIVKEILLHFDEDLDTIRMSNYYVLYEMIAQVGEINE